MSYVWPTQDQLAGFGAQPQMGSFGSQFQNPAPSLTGTNLLGMSNAGTVPAAKGLFDGTGLGANVGTAQLGLSALGSLGSLWGAFQANNLAKKQFSFAKETTNANLNNQIKSYNTVLSDRIDNRAAATNMTPEQVAEYKARNMMTR
jgi:hypothetical protein